jgi:hypothetical protein
MDVYVGLPRNVNDFHVLRNSNLYQCALNGGFFDVMVVGSQDGAPPYLLKNKGYPLLPLFMTLHVHKE